MEVKNRLKHQNISVSLPSQRVDRFDENIAQVVGGTRQTGLTFAPEAGTQRMRDIINKGLTNEELLRGVKTAYEQGWGKIKLYFMIGLPGETDVDVLGIAETVRWLRQECRLKGRRRLDFNITISNFTPKPHTPFQWHSVSTQEFVRKQDLLRQEFRPMKGVKVNFTDVRISAMEDFVGRGDRRLGAVVRHAWELGAGMDSWWESLDRAFTAWTDAIAAAGLTWKYRQVEDGEWNLMPHSPDNAPLDRVDQVDQAESPSAGMSQSETNSVTVAEMAARLDAPLPWDHLDTGISKQWLQDDLQRAFEAATVPDCAFEGCSHCGICGPDFGHNIVVPPPPIPKFEGHFVPNQTRSQRLRLWFGKRGSMALLGHLDLMRLFDRAVRRAGLPLTFTGGFHPSPRIMPANALPLGATSSGEVADFELTEPMEPAEFQTRLAAQLPDEIPLYGVEVVDLSAPSATKQLQQAEYTLAVAIAAESNPESDSESNIDTEFSAESNSASSAPSSAADEFSAQWQTWIDAILAADNVPYERTTKSGKKKTINLRERLYHLERVTTTNAIADVADMAQPHVLIRYVGSCRNDGTLLRPNDLLAMLEWASQTPMQLLRVHRNQLILR
jgi:radical SAM-linked protein